MLELIALTSLVFGGMTLLIVFYWRRVIDGSITTHFRAAEAVSEGSLPPEWVPRIERRLRLRRLLPGQGASGVDLAIKRLDRLERYFSRSTFLSDKEVQRVFLEQLESTRRRWREMSWEELRNLAGS